MRWPFAPARTGAKLAAGLLVAAAIAGCGDGGDDENGSGDASADVSADVSAARDRIDAFRQLPRFTAPGPGFAARANLRGKTIFEIPITSEVPFVTAVEQGMKDAANLVGAKLVVYRNQGRPDQWAQGIRTAISQKADAITLLAQNPELLGPQIAEAEKEGIPVIVLRTTGEREPCQSRPNGEPYGSACVPGPFEDAGRLEADWVIARTKGNADMLVITSNDAPSTASLVRALKDELKARCPGCEARYVDIPISQWAKQVRSEVQSALVRDPDIDYVVPIYDSMSQYAVPAIKASGKAGRVKIAAFNGTPFVLEMLQEDDVVQMDAGENLSWIGWASMDQVFRVIAGEDPVRSEHTPLRVFDDTNVDETGSPPRFDTGYGSAYVEGYKRLWQLGG
jgi:ribose transport system substrate-binding protein